eukprot:29437-Pelagococcus_subviridis.AAC.2
MSVGAPLTPMFEPANCTVSTSTYPRELEIFNAVAPVCRKSVIGFSSVTSPFNVINPDTVRVVERSALVREVAPLTPSEPETVALASVAAPVCTPAKVVAPVTPSVPVIVVSPALVTTKFRAPVVPTSSFPVTLAPDVARAMTSAVPPMPMVAPVNFTLSTST